MTNEDKKLIADYMEWIWLVEHYITKDNSRFLDRKIHFNLNDAALCVYEMQKRVEWKEFKRFFLPRWQGEILSTNGTIESWLMTMKDGVADNFFAAMAEWIKEVRK